MFAIIMAGGAGTRLWPLSRRGTPKQLLALTGDTSLLQQTVARAARLLKPHDIYVITSQAHVRATQEQLPQLPPDNVLGEPLARSTAVAAGLATVLARRESDEIAIVLPADHFVADEEAFAEGLREAARAAERGYLVTLGVVPSQPATGYGYIKAAAPLHPASATALVERFVEKPDAKTAAAFLEQGSHYWNAGIFVWRVYAFRQAIERFQPQLASALERIGELHRTPGWMSDVRDILEPVPAVTIDIGIAEPAAAEGRMAVVPLDAGWSDIGSWSALLEALSAASGADLVASGRHLDRDSHRVLVHGGDRLVVTVGL
jgi:mannose-1-phosphate guanylyltransferase